MTTPKSEKASSGVSTINASVGATDETVTNTNVTNITVNVTADKEGVEQIKALLSIVSDVIEDRRIPAFVRHGYLDRLAKVGNLKGV